jgi:radical SAM protein with 4Fe4S-binding SPASM domain
MPRPDIADEPDAGPADELFGITHLPTPLRVSWTLAPRLEARHLDLARDLAACGALIFSVLCAVGASPQLGGGTPQLDGTAPPRLDDGGPGVADLVRVLSSRRAHVLLAGAGSLAAAAAVALKEAGLGAASFLYPSPGAPADAGAVPPQLSAGALSCREAGLDFSIVTPVSGATAPHLAAIHRHVSGLGAAVWALSPRGLGGPDLGAAYRRAIELCRPGGPRLMIQDPLAVPLTGEEYGPAWFGSCPAGRTMLHIESDGAVYPCPRLPVRCGNALADGVRAVWDGSDELAGLRRARAGEPCRSCGHFHQCLGGCRARVLEAGGRPDGIDPACFLREGEPA